jgi:MarR family
LTAASWTFLTNHARVLLCIAHDPGIRLRDIAARLDITERSVYGVVTDLTQAGYIVKQKDGRRNRYQIQAHQPLPEPTSRERTVGEVLALLTPTGPGQPPAEGETADHARAATRVRPGPGSHQAARSASI